MERQKYEMERQKYQFAEMEACMQFATDMNQQMQQPQQMHAQNNMNGANMC